MLLDQLLVAAPAADPSGVTPLDALGLFVGIPVLIIAVIVGAVYGAQWRTLRSERAGATEPLTEPVLGRPDRLLPRPDREQDEAGHGDAAAASAAEDVPVGDAAVGDAPVGEVPGDEVPADDVPAEAAPVGDVRTGDAPSGDVTVGSAQQTRNDSADQLPDLRLPLGDRSETGVVVDRTTVDPFSE